MKIHEKFTKQELLTNKRPRKLTAETAGYQFMNDFLTV